MFDLTSLPKRRPAETASGVAGALAAIVALVTGVGETGAIMLVAVSAIPGLVTRVVSIVRSAEALQLVVNVTPAITRLASKAVEEAEGRSLKAKRATLTDVANALATWTGVIEAGTSASPEDGDEEEERAEEEEGPADSTR